MMAAIIEPIRKLYWRYEHHISSIGLVSGFIFDAITLKRVDQFFENLWIGLHLVPAAVCIILINILEGSGRREVAEPTNAKKERLHFWLVFALQFSFGGLLSAFLVFYFRSSTFASSWPFLALLALTFIFNELLKKHYSRLIFQISVFFISIYCYAIYMTPIAIHRVGQWVFLLSGVISLLIIALFLWILRWITRERFKNNRRLLYTMILGLFLFINILYFTNLIPPIPLSLQEAGVYHSVYRDAEGKFVLNGEAQGIRAYLLSEEIYHRTDDQPVYVYTAVFSPTKLNTEIVHNWQKYDEKKGEWVSISKIPLLILGGRDNGYRTFSKKYNVTPGLWRVDVETESGQDIGRVKFRVVGNNEG